MEISTKEKQGIEDEDDRENVIVEHWTETGEIY